MSDLLVEFERLSPLMVWMAVAAALTMAAAVVSSIMILLLRQCASFQSGSGPGVWLRSVRCVGR